MTSVKSATTNRTSPSGFDVTSQIRRKGRSTFPPVKWVAVIIINRAEWYGENTFEEAHKAGAIFKADEVFGRTEKLKTLVARATIDRQPFKFDQQQPTPGEQQRWIMVEKHAAAKRP